MLLELANSYLLQGLHVSWTRNVNTENGQLVNAFGASKQLLASGSPRFMEKKREDVKRETSKCFWKSQTFTCFTSSRFTFSVSDVFPAGEFAPAEDGAAFGAAVGGVADVIAA